jgi:hypothetical protein
LIIAGIGLNKVDSNKYFISYSFKNVSDSYLFIKSKEWIETASGIIVEEKNNKILSFLVDDKIITTNMRGTVIKPNFGRYRCKIVFSSLYDQTNIEFTIFCDSKLDFYKVKKSGMKFFMHSYFNYLAPEDNELDNKIDEVFGSDENKKNQYYVLFVMIFLICVFLIMVYDDLLMSIMLVLSSVFFLYYQRKYYW